MTGREHTVESAVDPEVVAVIRRSKTARTVDGFKPGEPKILACPHPECRATVLLDEDPDTPGWTEMDHSDECPHRRD